MEVRGQTPNNGDEESIDVKLMIIHICTSNLSLLEAEFFSFLSEFRLYVRFLEMNTHC